jgi:hypothetical protein
MRKPLFPPTIRITNTVKAISLSMYILLSAGRGHLELLPDLHKHTRLPQATRSTRKLNEDGIVLVGLRHHHMMWLVAGS